MLKPQGYATVTTPDGLIERDTYTCSHCDHIVHVKPRQDPSEMGGFCRVCMKNICKRCAGNPDCTPLLKRIEEIERRDRLCRAAGIF